jgi:hypothetical protein
VIEHQGQCCAVPFPALVADRTTASLLVEDVQADEMTVVACHRDSRTREPFINPLATFESTLARVAANSF